MDFLTLIQIKNIYLIQIIFLINFSLVFLIAYPLGHIIVNDKSCEKILFGSLISLSLFSSLIAISINFFAGIAKYLILIFIIINLIILIKKKNLIIKLIKKILINKFLILFIVILYFLFLKVYYPIELNNNNIEIPYNRHLIYFFSPVQEIYNADYFSRLRITSLYPMEWAAFYFFQSSLNSIFLNIFTNFGYLGLLFLKCFFLSIFISNFFFFLLKKIKIQKQNYSQKVAIFLFFISNLNHAIFGNEAIVIFSLFFLFKNLFNNEKNNNYFSNIMLTFGSFKNIFLAFYIFIYFSIRRFSNLFNINLLINSFKKIEKKYLFALFLLFFYLVFTFFSEKNVLGKFNLLGDYSMWKVTFSYFFYENKYLFWSYLFFIILIKFLYEKKDIFTKENLYFYLFVFSISLTAIFITYLTITFESLILELVKSKKLKTFLLTFNYENLKIYYIIPLLWLFLVNFNKDFFRIIIILSVSTYAYLSIIIHHHITIPAISFIELFFVFWITYLFVSNNLNIALKLQILVTILFINLTFFISENKNFKTESININILELSKFKKMNYLCPSDVKEFKEYRNVFNSDLLSGLLNKRYYSESAYNIQFNSYDHYHLAVPMAVPPKKDFYNPCKE